MVDSWRRDLVNKECFRGSFVHCVPCETAPRADLDMQSRCWALLGPLLAVVGPFGPFWALLGPFGPFWALVGPCGPLWAHLGPFGPFWALLGPFGPLLGPF